MKANVDESALANFEIVNDVLIVNAELYWENHAEFLRFTDRLVKSEKQDIILDLSQVTFVFSAYMGTIGRLLAECAERNKHLTIRIGRNLSWLFEIVGLERMVNIEVIP